jgi:tRNA-2-methylthio-N6-dimethylallyladenosine synthase
LVAEGEGRKDAATHRMTGRARDNRLVHFATPRVEVGVPSPASSSGGARIRPGDLVEVAVTHAAPHHLVADGPVLRHRRTRSGDAWEARTAPPTNTTNVVVSACPPSGRHPRSPRRRAAEVVGFTAYAVNPVLPGRCFPQ